MAKKESNLTLGISESKVVDEYIKKMNHPLLDVVKYIRKTVMDIDNNIGEGIFWNAPTFYYTGEMKPFNPKEYKRYIAGFNFYKQDAIRMVFLKGAEVSDPAGLLEGDYKDGRRISSFKNIDDFKSKEKDFEKIVIQLLRLMGSDK